MPATREMDPGQVVSQAVSSCLAGCGEPAGYLKVHTAAVQAFVEKCLVPSGQLNASLEALHQADAAIEQALRASARFVQFSASGRAIEVGQWWLNEELEAALKLEPPLADRTELGVLRFLQENHISKLDEIDAAVCNELRGLSTPDRELIAECVRSYAIAMDPEANVWQLRPQDAPAPRRQDLVDISGLLESLGKRLGYSAVAVKVGAEPSPLPIIQWEASGVGQSYLFYLTTTAVLGEIIFNRNKPEGLISGSPRRIVVLPGGRAALVEWKLQQNPRLRKEAGSGWSFVKFRHIRWMAESENLNRLNLQEVLQLDPLANQDPQMPLL